jgi:muramoyltetrapeptide carboxypeptidase
MNHPPYLKKGDRIGIVSPARSITFDEVHPTIRFFRKKGMEVVLGTYVFGKHCQFAGTDDQRRRDFQQMLDDPQIRAVISSRGGYGSVRIIDQLDFTKFRNHPKWIAGYSDITVFHSHIHQRFGIETLHSAMPVNIHTDQPDDSLISLFNALTGVKLSYSFPKTAGSREGIAEGILVGGNLSILYSLTGSVSDLQTDGKILFIEDVDEYLYHLDRMMMNLKRAGKLAKLKGLIVGGMSRMNDNAIPFGMDAREIILDAVKDYHYPVCFDFPAGHQEQNLTLILGRKIYLIVDKQTDISFV